jgi:hypothetical protein
MVSEPTSAEPTLIISGRSCLGRRGLFRHFAVTSRASESFTSMPPTLLQATMQARSNDHPGSKPLRHVHA